MRLIFRLSLFFALRTYALGTQLKVRGLVSKIILKALVAKLNKDVPRGQGCQIDPTAVTCNVDKGDCTLHLISLPMPSIQILN